MCEPKVAEQVESAGYRAAFSLKPNKTIASESIYRYPRIAVYRCDTLSTFQAKLGLRGRHRFKLECVKKQRHKPFFLFEPAPALTKGHRENAEMEKQSFARSGMQNQFSKSILPFFDYLIVLRPTLLFPVWTLVLLGHYHGAAPTSHSLKIEFLAAEIPVYLNVDARVWVTLCLYSMLAGAVYIINQITDKETDSVNNKLYLVADGYVKLPVIKLEAALLFIASIVAAVVWFHHSWAYLALIAVSTALGVIYSVRPFRLKGKPILDLLSNAIGYGGIAFLLGWAATATLNAEALQRAISLCLLCRRRFR